MPRLVPRLAGANRWLELARSAAFGRSAGGAAAGASAAYALATALSLLAALLLAGLPTRAATARRHIGRELTEGAAFVLRHPLLRPVLVTAVFFNVAWFVLQAVRGLCHPRPGAGRRRRGPDAGDLWPGHAGRRAAGAAPGALAELRRADRRRPAVRAAGQRPDAADPGAPLARAGALAFFLFGAGPILWTIATTTLRQAVTPNAMLGRVSAVILTATFGARPVGALIGAALAEQVDIAACLWVSALGFALHSP